MVKYLVAPARMPDELTWFKWEAYTTWLSGFALLVIVYYLGAELYLIDKSVLDVSAPMAAADRVRAACVVAWLLYEGLCRSPLGAARGRDVAHRLRVPGRAHLRLYPRVQRPRRLHPDRRARSAPSWWRTSSSSSFPYQKKTVAALIAGKEPKPEWGEEGKRRSVHNNYLTLPVVFLMIANHYPLLFATRYNWLIVAIVLAIGPVIRHFFNSRHEGKGSPWWTWGVAARRHDRGGVALGRRPARAGDRRRCRQASTRRPPHDMVALPLQHVPHARAGLGRLDAPPKDVRARQPREHRRHARLIEINAVRSDAMPPGNVTEMTATSGNPRRLARGRRAGEVRRSTMIAPRTLRLSARPRRLRPQPARPALAGRRARRRAVRRQLRGRRRAQHPAWRRDVGGVPLRRARRAAVAGPAPHERRVDVRIRLARRLLAAVAPVHRAQIAGHGVRRRHRAGAQSRTRSRRCAKPAGRSPATG